MTFHREIMYTIFFQVLSILGIKCQAHVKSALIVIDVQNCFIPGGSLGVPDGDSVVHVINFVRQSNIFDMVVTTQDWHCPDHVSFTSQHPNHHDFDVIELKYDIDGNLCNDNLRSRDCTEGEIAFRLNQTLWPNHCIMNTEGAQLSGNLITDPEDIIVKKGFNCEVDSYSAFFDNGGFSKTDLDQILTVHGVERVFLTGLALDFCVFYTAMDAVHLAYETYVIVDATRGISEAGSVEALAKMEAVGVKLIMSSELPAVKEQKLGLSQHK